MTTICASNHSHCCIRCANGAGYAIYREPSGPCRAGCDTGGVAQPLFEVHGTDTFWTSKSSASIREISGRNLADLMREIRQKTPNADGIHKKVEEVETEAQNGQKELFDFQWRNLDGKQVIERMKQEMG